MDESIKDIMKNILQEANAIIDFTTTETHFTQLCSFPKFCLNLNRRNCNLQQICKRKSERNNDLIFLQRGLFKL